jgi:molybdopterin synthase catalytic subunit
VLTSPAGDDWLSLTLDRLPADDALRWVERPDCGAVVVFSGNVRDHAEGRPGVSRLEYEAYEEQVVPRLERIVAEARRQWPQLGRVVAWHRHGALEVGDCAVVVAVSTPHRAEAFEAGRWIIDTVKASLPMWKHETWAGGEGWGTDAADIVEVGP